MYLIFSSSPRDVLKMVGSTQTDVGAQLANYEMELSENVITALTDMIEVCACMCVCMYDCVDVCTCAVCIIEKFVIQTSCVTILGIPGSVF